MELTIQQKPQPASQGFVDRRQRPQTPPPDGSERRQFGNSYASMSPEVSELAEAIDRYKLQHRRRFITFEELHNVITTLGYRK